ncbi:MAG TPA: NADH-quinone oxidoreductase subunit C [Chloroflexota bacterium]|nr:NADH-quinone oxidoreductase subunit C [Chloroflexota bacterium]
MMQTPPASETVAAILRDAGEGSRRITTATVRAADLAEAVRLLGERSGTAFADLFAVDERAHAGRFQLHLVWAFDRTATWLDLVVDVDPGQPWYPSITPVLPVAGWYEREIRDELGIEPRGHPGLRRLRRPADWPADAYLLRRELDWAAPVPRVAASAEDELFPLAPAPEGVVDYPLGPVRSGVVESGHYTLRTVGEELVDLRLQLFYKHRGVEKRAEGLGLLHAPLVAERISGTSAFAHSLALCQAIERASGAVVPERARYLRTLFAELERLYNHVGYQADLCQATGLGVGQAQCEILKERLLRLNAAVASHRYLFGLNVPGGLARDLDAPVLGNIRRALHELRAGLDTLDPLLLGSASHLDRLEGTGILRPDDARAFGAVGPIGRASGIDRDLRRDHPYAAYDAVDFAVPVIETGDALARFRIRLAEARESIRIAEQVIDAIPGGPISAEIDLPPEGATGLGWAESTRGESLHWVAFGPDGTIARYRARPASFANWQAFPLAVPGHNILTDFPVIEQSFGLSFAGADR